MIFVGVGSPNPLFIRQRRFRDTVGRFSSTFQCRDMNIGRQSTINSTCTVRVSNPYRSMGEATSPLRLQMALQMSTRPR